ncbi:MULTISPECIES: 2-oxoglutarate and iron-dependent oxygenase domain-containing protein [unclassified Modicisalibacter]|uniref:isopenicillin N synthase family dioxygenase n=1 Tax=unclassified Modicisalibacter TaxID=2679913 RepID=UPI001CC9F5EF|nr:MULTISPECIES: 2-oxoglutarate and iron-dependent oxygenase domain-containing protein [unclassified Modicisalibacter]MBZ9556462.1 isopenicillin N synthase family oxygenase [Modicisalibacter sp. R2A 31.J]MBZ9575069.1 isopenicillin N synthase family oxygenase [Modicisalibacter sp. MOD 31.J]
MATVITGNGPRAVNSNDLDSLVVPFSAIPVIDFSAMRTADADARRAVGDAVRKACTEVGFFYAKGHGVPQPVIERTFDAARQFFALPLEDKLKVDISRSPNLRGYTGLLEENTNAEGLGDLHEGFDIALDLPADDPDVVAGKFGYGPNQWPDDLPGFKDALLDYQSAVLDFGQTIFAAFALALDLEEDFFAPMSTKPMAQMRVLSYPSQEGPIDENQIGIGPHSDYECFTILCTDDIPSLQVLNCAGEWIQAPPIPGAFIVNVGDLMARWTNGYFASTLHRAINRSGKQRYSIPFFYGPDADAMIEVLPSCQNENWPPQFAPIKASDYIQSRFNETYAHRRADAPS